MELKGKVAIVTGGAVRLGRAMALALAERGVRVTVHYYASADPAQQLVSEIESVGSAAIAVQADLRDVSQAPGIVEQTVAHFGQLDILINSAAIFEAGSWENTTEESWDRHFSINLKSPFFLAQAFAKQVGQERPAHIVNIADWRAVHPGTGHFAYTLTKAGLVAMTKSLAQALAPSIRVNAIAPGLILPPPGKGPEYLVQDATKIPLRQPGSPDEIVRAMVFLLTSEFVTGELIYVTGGEHLMVGRQA